MTRLREAMNSTPERIAADINTLGLTTTVTSDEVRFVATNLCASGYQAGVVTTWLEGTQAVTSTLLLSPAKNLLSYSASICSRGPTVEEERTYVSGVVSALSPVSTVPSPPAWTLTSGESAVCEVLDSNAGGKAAEIILGDLTRLATRNRVDPDQFIPLAVAIAGKSCPWALQRMKATAQQYVSQRVQQP